jgi:hypothetical protein
MSFTWAINLINCKIILHSLLLFNLLISPPQPAGCVTGTLLLLLLSKKYAAHFLNSGKPEPNQKMQLIQLLF